VTSLQSSNDITAVLCCYTLARWSDITAGVRALGEQTRLPEVILIVVDHNDELLGKARAELPALAGVTVEVVPNAHRQGLSGARNTAIETARTEQIAFLDDDARPEPDWLERLANELKDESVLIAGGRSTPRWPGERPRWFPAEFDWVVGSTYQGMPTEAADVLRRGRRPGWCAAGRVRRDRTVHPRAPAGSRGPHPLRAVVTGAPPGQ